MNTIQTILLTQGYVDEKKIHLKLLEEGLIYDSHAICNSYGFKNLKIFEESFKQY
jgi:hypothetical protein